MLESDLAQVSQIEVWVLEKRLLMLRLVSVNEYLAVARLLCQ